MSDTSNNFGITPPSKVDWRQVPECLRDMYDRPGFLVRRCYQIAVSIFVKSCEPFGVTPSQYSVLYAVARVPGVTQIEVAKILGLDRSTTGSVVNRLEDNGLLHKRVSQSDRRKHTLQLTEEGERKYELTQNVVANEMSDRLLAPLSDEDREIFLRCLREIMQAHDEIVRAPVGFEKI